MSFHEKTYKILVEPDEPGFPMVVKNKNGLYHPAFSLFNMLSTECKWLIFLARLYVNNKIDIQYFRVT